MDEQAAEVLEVRWRLGDFRAGDLRAIADRLLGEGESSDALVELFALDEDEVVWEGPKLFERALVELGATPSTDAEAAAILARDIATRLLSGALTPSEATQRGARLHALSDHRFDCLEPLYTLDEEVSWPDRHGRTYLGREAREAEEDVRAFARDLLGGSSDPEGRPDPSDRG